MPSSSQRESSKPASAGDSALTAGADVLGDISDSDEDDWYLQDVKVWMSHTWHNNYKGEQKLRLKPAV
eukprot:2798280-Heterocapsa_arctica.AAC.1